MNFGVNPANHRIAAKSSWVHAPSIQAAFRVRGEYGTGDTHLGSCLCDVDLSRCVVLRRLVERIHFHPVAVLRPGTVEQRAALALVLQGVAQILRVRVQLIGHARNNM